MRKALLIVLLLFSWCMAPAQKRDFNIINYGAIRGMSSNNTEAIQKAIDAASKTGGRVVIPDGNFVTGPLHLKSGVELHLENDAVLLGSTKRVDYGIPVAALINVNGQHDIMITGKGIINGQGRDLVEDILSLLRAGKITDPQWLLKRPTESSRPHIIYMQNCQRVNVKGVTIKNSACWVQTYRECTDLTVDSVTVHSNEYWNNDGIDIVDSKEVKITNSYFNSADDAICLKSENKNSSCENVYVENCRLRSSANGFKIGTGSLGGFKNITVKGLTVFDTYRSAVALETVDGGFLQDVNISNVKAVNTGNAVFIRLGHRNTDERYSSINNVTISDVRVEVPTGKPDIGYILEGLPPKVPPHNLVPSSIVGIPGHKVQNVTLRNVEIVFGGGAVKEKAYISTDSLSSIPENINGYPEFTMFGELPAWGIYVRHAQGLKLENFKVSVQEKDCRPALVFDDVNGLNLNQISVPQNIELPVIVYRAVSKLSTSGLTVPAKSNAVLIQNQ